MQKVAGSRQEARKLIISGMICLWKTALLLRLDEPMRDHKKIISLVTLEIK
jgi:nucleoside-triphosphatase THEP1